MVEIGAFQNCTSLTSFAFPQSLSEVQGWTFVGCRKLKEITLPKSVKKVGDQALRTNYGCIYNHRTTKTNQKYPSVNL